MDSVVSPGANVRVDGNPFEMHALLNPVSHHLAFEPSTQSQSGFSSGEPGVFTR